MKTKRIFGLLVLLSLIFVIANVSAADVDVAGEDSIDDLISSDEIDDNLKYDENTSFSNLNDEIVNNYGGNLKLEKDYVYDAYEDVNFTDGIPISKPIAIDGQGHSIDANSASSIFYIKSDNVTLKNLTFLNGYNDEWTFVFTGSNISISDCKFIRCTSDKYGPTAGSGENINITNCNFENCFSKSQTGALELDGSNINLDNCIFTGCRSMNAVGVLFISGSQNNIRNSSFRNSSSDNYGAVYIDGDYNTIMNCSFENSKSKGYCGAVFIYGNYNDIVESNFDNCDAAYYGGAVYIEGNYGNIVYCDFRNSKSNIHGGAIYIYGDGSDIISCNFYDSSSGVGTIYIAGENSDIQACDFVNSSADKGAAIYAYGDAYIINCNFINCSSETAAVHLDNNGKISHSRFINCSAGGGVVAVYFGGSNSTLDFCELMNCSSNGTSNGCAVYFTGSDNSVNSCEFTDCKSNGHGGAVYFASSNNTVRDSNFTGCSAGAGGAVYFNGSSNAISGSSFNNCSADNGGGAFFGSCDSNVLKSSFTDCSAEYNGGGIFFANRDFTVDASTFNGNSAKNGSDYYPVILSTNIVASGITTYYGVSKNLVITLKDENGAMSEKDVVIVFNNKAHSGKTDSKGQFSLTVPANLAPNTYPAKITFAGDDTHDDAAKSVNVIVKKANPKITAKAKTFKKSVKTKKYTITLKNNLNKVIRNAKVTLKVNKKTYSAKTNNKGVATFKITKLTKKGKFTATVKYAGNKYYNAKSAKVKITVK